MNYHPTGIHFTQEEIDADDYIECHDVITPETNLDKLLKDLRCMVEFHLENGTRITEDLGHFVRETGDKCHIQIHKNGTTEEYVYIYDEDNFEDVRAQAYKNIIAEELKVLGF